MGGTLSAGPPSTKNGSTYVRTERRSIWVFVLDGAVLDGDRNRPMGRSVAFGRSVVPAGCVRVGRWGQPVAFGSVGGASRLRSGRSGHGSIELLVNSGQRALTPIELFATSVAGFPYFDPI
jgi:hypothetical protein